MSVRFEKETVRDTSIPGGNSFRDSSFRGDSGIRGDSNDRRHNHRHLVRGIGHDIAHDVGERLTGGGTASGYLAAYLKQLQSNPLRTKMLTSGTLAAFQEILASWIAQDHSKHGYFLTPRVPKMAIYGTFISAPLGHVLIGLLQKVFAGRTSLRAKVLQILVSNLVISPIQNVVYLTSMAIIAGARTFHQIQATIRAGLLPVMKVSWITSPLALAFAQKFLPEQTWVPFFNIIAFIIGTYINAHTKKKRLAALRRKHYNDSRGSTARADDHHKRDDYGKRSGGGDDDRHYNTSSNKNNKRDDYTTKRDDSRRVDDGYSKRDY